jgi:hypothetical protein
MKVVSANESIAYYYVSKWPIHQLGSILIDNVHDRQQKATALSSSGKGHHSKIQIKQASIRTGQQLQEPIYQNGPCTES